MHSSEVSYGNTRTLAREIEKENLLKEEGNLKLKAHEQI